MKNTYSASQKWDKKTFKNIIVAAVFIPIIGIVLGLKEGFKNTAVSSQAKIVLIISIFSAIMWINIFGMLSSDSSTIEESEYSNIYVQSVYDGHLKKFPDKTIGKVINKHLDDVQWTAYEKMDTRFSEVYVVGNIKVSGKIERLRFIFLVDNKDKSIIELSGANTETEGFFEPQAIEIYKILYNK